jgi:N-acetylmuramoyl-L-alanine amidase
MSPIASRRLWLAGWLVGTIGGCARPMLFPDPPPAGVTPAVAAEHPVATAPAAPVGIPPVPAVRDGLLRPRVVYPVRDQLVAVRDSNFIFGSIGSGDAELTINGTPVSVQPNGAYLAYLPVPRGTTPGYELIVRRGTDSASYVHPIRTPASVASAPRPPSPPAAAAPPPPPPPGAVALGVLPGSGSDPDRPINVRPIANGTYKWLLLPGTIVERVATQGAMTRIRLDSALDAFVATSDIVELPTARALPNRVVPNMRVVPDTGWTDVIFPLSDAPPFLIEEEADKLVVTLYSTRATTDIIAYRPGDRVVRAVTWEPLHSDRVKYVIHLREAPFGYFAFHDGRQFIVRVRRTPAVTKEHPLRGITVAVDAGHPPAGSTGPTGIPESALTLPIAQALQRELERRGARVVMTRETDSALGLQERPAAARAAGAHAFVSIHLNALPDGVNPFNAHGTGTYYFTAHSEPLARAVQAGMVHHMQLRDQGIFYDNLAVIRPSWMPAVLAEGAFIMVPEQDAAMQTPQGQRAYAMGVADGIEAYFRSLAR